MRGWVIGADRRPGARPVLRELPTPAPGPDELLVEVSACGVCRTDLHLVEGDLPVHAPEVVPGHETVGRVVGLGTAVRGFARGDRVGVAWLRRTCGECRWCRSGAENLCPSSEYTGWDADGGYAELATVPAAFAYRLPPGYDDVTAAPLLCAGIIGYRALKRAQLPPGGNLGIYGFGGSAHITAQVAAAAGARVHVLTRGAAARTLAAELGAASVAGPTDEPPVPLDSAIVFAPAGELVPLALKALERGGTVALAGIHMSDVPRLDYAEHLFREKSLRSVTSNTRADGDELFRLAATIRLRIETTGYPLEAAATALADLSAGRFAGAAVLDVSR